MTDRNNQGIVWLSRNIRPLWFREKLFYHLRDRFIRQTPDMFKRARLALAPGAFMDLEPGDVSHQIIAGTGLYESPVSSRIARLAMKGGLLVDVGANYGYYSIVWAASRETNRVIAFEASPANVKALRKNILQNRLQERVEIHEAAVGDGCRTVYFQVSPGGETGQGGLAPEGMTTPLQVTMTTLDEHLLKTDSAIDVLKIDVEGADSWVLEGAEGLIKSQRIRHIFFEQYAARMQFLGVAQQRAFELLRDHGYQVREIAPSEHYATLGKR